MSKVLVKASPLRSIKTARYVGVLALKAKCSRCASECSVLASNRHARLAQHLRRAAGGQDRDPQHILPEYCQGRIEGMCKLRSGAMKRSTSMLDMTALKRGRLGYSAILRTSFAVLKAAAIENPRLTTALTAVINAQKRKGMLIQMPTVLTRLLRTPLQAIIR